MFGGRILNLKNNDKPSHDKEETFEIEKELDDIKQNEVKISEELEKLQCKELTNMKPRRGSFEKTNKKSDNVEVELDKILADRLNNEAKISENVKLKKQKIKLKIDPEWEKCYMEDNEESDEKLEHNNAIVIVDPKRMEVLFIANDLNKVMADRKNSGDKTIEELESKRNKSKDKINSKWEEDLIVDNEELGEKLEYQNSTVSIDSKCEEHQYFRVTEDQKCIKDPKNMRDTEKSSEKLVHQKLKVIVDPKWEEHLMKDIEELNYEGNESDFENEEEQSKSCKHELKIQKLKNNTDCNWVENFMENIVELDYEGDVSHYTGSI